MALYQYFKKSTVLPNPEGSLSNHMPSAAIVSANKEVDDLVFLETDEANQSERTSCKKKRGHYLSYTDDEKLKIAKRAAEFGVTKTMRHFKKQFSDCPLKESTVRT